MLVDDWLTVTQAAELSGYHPERIRELLRQGNIEGKKFGPLWVVSRSSLKNYIIAAKKSGDKRQGPKSSKTGREFA